jgi:hypothetical protein
LRTVAAHVFNRYCVSPGNLLLRNAECGGQTLALQRAGNVIPVDDGFDKLPVQLRGRGKLGGADAGLLQVASDRFFAAEYRFFRRASTREVLLTESVSPAQPFRIAGRLV